MWSSNPKLSRSRATGQREGGLRDLTGKHLLFLAPEVLQALLGRVLLVGNLPPLRFAIGIANVSLLGQRDLRAGLLGVNGMIVGNAKVALEVVDRGLQLVLTLGGDDEHPVAPPVVVFAPARGRPVLRGQGVGLVGPFEDHVLVHAALMQQVPELQLAVRPNQLGRTLAGEGNVDRIERVAILGTSVHSFPGFIDAVMFLEILLALAASGDLAGFHQLPQVFFERGVGAVLFEVFDLEKQEAFVVPRETGPVDHQ